MDDTVGYKRPPKSSQFSKGQSGNPKGRPRGAEGRRNILERVAYETHTVREGGRKRRLTTIEALLVTLRNMTMEGDPRAAKLYDEFYRKHLPDQEQKGGFLYIPTRA